MFFVIKYNFYYLFKGEKNAILICYKIYYLILAI